MTIEAFIDCHPPTRTAQQKGARVMRKRGSSKFVLRFFTKTELKAAEKQLRSYFQNHRPHAPLVGPLKLTITWTWHWYAYEIPLRKKGQFPQWIPSVNDPDFDNLMKLPCDVLTKLGFWADDAHVSSATIQKGRGDRPGIHFRLEPWNMPDWYTPPEGDVVAEVQL